MTEVAKKAAFYISRRPSDSSEVKKWSERAARVVNEIIMLSQKEREIIKEKGVENARRFSTKLAMDKIEKIYKDILKSEKEA